MNQEFLQGQLDLIKERQTDPNIEWQDVVDYRYKAGVVGQPEARDTVRKGAKLLQEYIDNGWQILPPSSTSGEDIGDSIFKLQNERKKIQAEKIEYNRLLRENSRDELLIEKIHDAIMNIPPLDFPDVSLDTNPSKEKEYLLTVSDCHYGIEFCLQGFNGEIINEYSPEIFQLRMSKLLGKVMDTIEKEHITKLTVFELGDAIQGMLRLNSQLMQLRYGVVDSTVRYALFFAQWINQLSKYVKVELHMVKDSNHNQLRLCNTPKNAFPDENMSTVITTIITERLKGNKNVEIKTNPTGMNYTVMCGYPILGIHGETKDLGSVIDEYKRVYKIPVSYVFRGHVHHKQSEEVGRDSEVYSVGSIIGTDSYGLRLGKTSNPTANMFVFQKGEGVICEYTYNLK